MKGEEEREEKRGGKKRTEGKRRLEKGVENA